MPAFIIILAVCIKDSLGEAPLLVLFRNTAAKPTFSSFALRSIHIGLLFSIKVHC